MAARSGSRSRKRRRSAAAAAAAGEKEEEEGGEGLALLLLQEEEEEEEEEEQQLDRRAAGKRLPLKKGRTRQKRASRSATRASMQWTTRSRSRDANDGDDTAGAAASSPSSARSTRRGGGGAGGGATATAAAAATGAAAATAAADGNVGVTTRSAMRKTRASSQRKSDRHSGSHGNAVASQVRPGDDRKMPAGTKAGGGGSGAGVSSSDVVIVVSSSENEEEAEEGAGVVVIDDSEPDAEETDSVAATAAASGIALVEVAGDLDEAEDECVVCFETLETGGGATKLCTRGCAVCKSCMQLYVERKFRLSADKKNAHLGPAGGDAAASASSSSSSSSSSSASAASSADGAEAVHNTMDEVRCPSCCVLIPLSKWLPVVGDTVSADVQRMLEAEFSVCHDFGCHTCFSLFVCTAKQPRRMQTRFLNGMRKKGGISQATMQEFFKQCRAFAKGRRSARDLADLLLVSLAGGSQARARSIVFGTPDSPAPGVQFCALVQHPAQRANFLRAFLEMIPAVPCQCCHGLLCSRCWRPEHSPLTPCSRVAARRCPRCEGVVERKDSSGPMVTCPSCSSSFNWHDYMYAGGGMGTAGAAGTAGFLDEDEDEDDCDY